MNRLVIPAALAAAVALGAAVPAHAAVDKPKVAKAMAPLLGFWAVDCAKAPSSDNPWETFRVDADGYVVNGDYEGTDGESAYVVEARRQADGKIWFRWEVTLGEPELELVYEIKGNRHRTWSSRSSDGTWLMEDGVWDTDQEPGHAQWYTKCPGDRFPDQPPDA